jgi:hypothetical protein
MSPTAAATLLRVQNTVLKDVVEGRTAALQGTNIYQQEDERADVHVTVESKHP